MIDTHTHLYMADYEGLGHEAVDRAIAAGVNKMIFPNVDLESIAPMRDLAHRYPSNVYMAMGLHPTEVKESWQEDLEQIVAEIDGDKYVALGEIGMDLYWDKQFEHQQMLAFERQMQQARDRNLPVIIHCREAQPQTLEVMSEFPDVPAVFHSFGGTVEEVKAIRRVGDYYFGINGIVTFKNCHVRDSLAEIGLDRLLLETDAPFLAPVPLRGKRNESAYVPYIAAHIANHLGLSVSEIDERTTANATRLFRL